MTSKHVALKDLQSLDHRANLVCLKGYNPNQPFKFYPFYHKDHCPVTIRGLPTEQNGENSGSQKIGKRREQKKKGSLDLEDFLGDVHFHLVTQYPETSLLLLVGVEMSEIALREKIVWRRKRFSVWVYNLLVYIYLQTYEQIS